MVLKRHSGPTVRLDLIVAVVQSVAATAIRHTDEVNSTGTDAVQERGIEWPESAAGLRWSQAVIEKKGGVETGRFQRLPVAHTADNTLHQQHWVRPGSASRLATSVVNDEVAVARAIAMIASVGELRASRGRSALTNGVTIAALEADEIERLVDGSNRTSDVI